MASSFVDKARISVHAGKGGDGAVAFHREKYVAAGGPDGGDGGRGGNVVFVVDDNMSTLMDFRYKRKYTAGNGMNGQGKRCYGKDGETLYIKVPRGTIVRDTETGAIMHDMSTGANGYGEYFGNGKYYGNRDAYLYALWEEELNSGKPVGSFEAWKMQKGYNASGTDFWRGGRTLLGENGPEEVVLPRGSRILTAQETRQSGGGDIYYVTIEARTVKEFNDIARIARNKRRTDRMGVDKE